LLLPSLPKPEDSILAIAFFILFVKHENDRLVKPPDERFCGLAGGLRIAKKYVSTIISKVVLIKDFNFMVAPKPEQKCAKIMSVFQPQHTTDHRFWYRELKLTGCRLP
jgi:hypothetical protein